MARDYDRGVMRRGVNRVFSLFVRFGRGPAVGYNLVTVGAKSGKARSTPVNVNTIDGVRWLVSPYGAVGWVHNVRASGEATLQRGGRDERVRLEEVDAAAAGPVLKYYAEHTAITRPYFDASHEDGVDAFVAEASLHPTFRVLTSG